MTPCLDCGRLVRPLRRAHRAILCDPCHRRRQARRLWYKGDWPTVSQALRERAETCEQCGEGFTPANPATVDHVAPRSREAGLRVLCRRCNSSKGATVG